MQVFEERSDEEKVLLVQVLRAERSEAKQKVQSDGYILERVLTLGASAEQRQQRDDNHQQQILAVYHRIRQAEDRRQRDYLALRQFEAPLPSSEVFPESADSDLVHDKDRAVVSWAPTGRAIKTGLPPLVFPPSSAQRHSLIGRRKSV